MAARGDLVVVVGVSSSPGLATPGAFQQSLDPIWDCAIIIGFDPAGVKKFGTYVCPEISLYSVALGDQGQIYVAGTAEGEFAGQTTPGAHQPVYGGGGTDAYLAQFDDKGARVWSTYYGGGDPGRVQEEAGWRHGHRAGAV